MTTPRRTRVLKPKEQIYMCFDVKCHRVATHLVEPGTLSGRGSVSQHLCSKHIHPVEKVVEVKPAPVPKLGFLAQMANRTTSFFTGVQRTQP